MVNYDRKFAQSPSLVTSTFLYTLIGGMFHGRQIPNFSRPSTLFPKQLKTFQFPKFKDLIQDCP